MERDIIYISGMSGEQIAPEAARVAEELNAPALIITPSALRAKKLAKNLSFFISREIHTLSGDGNFFFQYAAKSREDMELRLRALVSLRKRKNCVVVAPVSGAMKRLPPVSAFDRSRLKLRAGGDMEPERFKNKLASLGFEHMPYVESRGGYSARGDIVDFFPVEEDSPRRVEFFDTRVDSIRVFDAKTQRSLRPLEETEIFPAEQMAADAAAFERAGNNIADAYDRYVRKWGGERGAALERKKKQILEYIETKTNLQFLENYIGYFYEEAAYIWDYLGDEGVVMLDDPDRVSEALSLSETEAKEDFKRALAAGHAIPEDLENFSGLDSLKKIYGGGHRLYVFTPFMKAGEEGDRVTARRHIEAKQPPVIAGRMDVLESELKRYVKEKYRTTIVCSSDERAENLKDFLERAGLAGKISLKTGDLASGVEFPERKIVYLRDGEIFNNHIKRRTGREKSGGNPIKTFSDIRKGDFVVHENHGIGKFTGIEQLSVQNISKDYLKIKYAGEDMLYIPVEQMSVIQKYSGGNDAKPTLSKLSGGDWKRVRSRAKKDIANLAKELLEVSAARKARPGYAFSADTVWQKEFEDAFPYEATQDQLRSIASIKLDMEKPAPMDRLLCGDVGYGKTEVAARAVFKCVADGKQAAILAPTTILANQHYITFKKRFESFPFTVEMLSRFRTKGQQKTILENLRRGSLDVLIGTHRMLSKDVIFKDLGFLVVDEEQRFGVKDKEKIKALRENIDVLTLSATPIPRTLHMSLMGVRDMDLIAEPPEDRYPVQTYVTEQDDELMREIIRRELDREGQVYVVYNRIIGIQRVAAEIKKLVPEAEIAVGHGRMDERDLENVMMDFIEGRYNVLVATAIIESGIDIPNVNTMLVLDADRFGLSQLYQLRGRVGRSNRMAYAYMMYRKGKTLSEVGEKRLRAIREFTEFGAGFHIAMRDLEIRGAGNILGTEQHGHMSAIGYELYCKLVDDAIRALSGETLNSGAEEAAVEIAVAAHIPDSYIGDEALKLQMYRKIAFVETDEDETEIINELADRFGDIPGVVMNLVRTARVRAMASRGGVQKVREGRGGLIFDMRSASALKPEAISAVSGHYKTRILIHGGAKPFISLKLNDGGVTTQISAEGDSVFPGGILRAHGQGERSTRTKRVSTVPEKTTESPLPVYGRTFKQSLGGEEGEKKLKEAVEFLRRFVI
jgi:transcription-repair coupling factor (superfamily II helicase)